MEEKATFAAGCFWGVEAAFASLPGVRSTQVGYTGGAISNPTYKQVCTDQTGHAEAVEILFDPEKIAYEKLLEFFATTHDPTQVNRQGPDTGTQYRTAIFFHNRAQEAAAQTWKQTLEKSGRHPRPIATLIVPAATFWSAEEYHQKYLAKRGQTSCGTGH